jgi:aconitate hydratase
MPSANSFNARTTLTVGGKTYTIFSLPDASAHGLGDVSRLPVSLKVLLENLLRKEDGWAIKAEDVRAIAAWASADNRGKTEHEIGFTPARVLMQDFTGVPAVVDLAAMRDAAKALGADPQKVNPLVPVDLVIDHSVMVDHFAKPDSFKKNVDLEYSRNAERYQFLRWGSTAFNNFRVVPPGTGICHQVNLEYLAQTVWVNDEGVAYPDTLVGTDSHTTMINGLAVLGWGVGGIEAEAAMLGQPISMLIPEVIGFRLTGKLKEGATATDLVLTVTQMLRKKGVVGKFVEFYGPGLTELALEDRATIANMAPEYGATSGFFPVDGKTLEFLRETGRDPARVALVEAYAKAQGMWFDPANPEPEFTDTLHLDLSSVEPSLAGPKRPQDRVALSGAAAGFMASLAGDFGKAGKEKERFPVAGESFDLGHGDVTIAAITSCTNTSNPSVMLGAGLLARNARAKGLKVKPWVKTSLAPGSQVVTDYLAKAGLNDDLDALGFNLVGYGCTTCIGNSGPLPEAISKTISAHDVIGAAVISGNRNFEGRVSPDVKANYLASPMLVVAYALAGSMQIDITKEPLGAGADGQPVYLKDVWPSNDEIARTVRAAVTAEMFASRYADVFKGDAAWQAIQTGGGQTYGWDGASTYVANPPYFDAMSMTPKPLTDVAGARILALFGDSITTDHISPAGDIKAASPAGGYLQGRGVTKMDFNSYGARRGHHEVMMRGTFANIRIKNAAAPGTEGGVTTFAPTGEVMPIYDAAMKYQGANTPLIIFAGKEYGTGSSRDWAAKGTRLLGVRAVVAESFERIHRSNLIGMGVLPLQFKDGGSWGALGLKGDEVVSLSGVTTVQPRQSMTLDIQYADGSKKAVPVLCRIDTENELDYFKNGGILHFVLRNLAKAA